LVVRMAVEEACEEVGAKFVAASGGLAGDNGAMVALMGRYLYNKGRRMNARMEGIAPFARGKEREHRGRRR